MVGHSKRLAQPLSRGQRRGMGISLAVLLVVIVAATAYGLSSRGSYGASRNGCVNVSVPSTLGGGLLHSCGAAARAWCRQVETQNDAVSRLARPQCVLAGITPAPAKSSG